MKNTRGIIAPLAIAALAICGAAFATEFGRKIIAFECHDLEQCAMFGVMHDWTNNVELRV